MAQLDPFTLFLLHAHHHKNPLTNLHLDYCTDNRKQLSPKCFSRIVSSHMAFGISISLVLTVQVKNLRHRFGTLAYSQVLQCWLAFTP